MEENQRHINQAEYIADGHEDATKSIVQGIEEMHNTGVNKNSMVVEENQVIDVVDLINDSGNSAIAIRIKTLLENGITEAMLERKYMDISSGVSDKGVALGNLRSVCDMFIKYLSDIPNGVVINEITGEIDRERSIQQAVEYGILTERDVIIIDPISQAFEIHKNPTITEILENSKFFSAEEKEITYWNYNRDFGDKVNYSNNSQWNWDVFVNDYTEMAKKSGKSDEDIKKDIDMFKYYKFDSTEEIDFAMKAIFFANKDTHVPQEFLDKVLGKYSNLKFYKNVINEKGEVDLEKIKIFANELIEVTNRHTLSESLNAYNKLNGDISLEGLDSVNKANLNVVLARAYFAEDDVCKNAFKELCEKLGIDTSLTSILEVTGYRDEHELKRVASENEINNKNYRKVLSDIKINKQMTSAEKMIYELAENRNLHIEDERESIARLYMMYCEKAKDAELYSMESNTYKEISKAIEHYMLDKKEYFTEYFTYYKDSGIVVNKLNYAHVKKVIGDKEPSKKTALLMETYPKKIDRVLETIKGEDLKISQKEFDEFFLVRSEELAISYNQEAEIRKNEKKNQKDRFEKEDKTDYEKEKIYNADTIDDLNFAQVALFYANKSYKITPEMLNNKLFKYRNSKFYAAMLDENNEIDLEKLKEFSETWTKEFNRVDLRNETVKFLLLTKKTNVKMEDLDEVNRRNLKGILARGFFEGDTNNKKAFNKLCENLGIGNDLESILKATGCVDLEDLEEIKEEQELNKLNYREKISEKRIAKQMSLGEKMVFEMGDKLDLYNPENREAIARVYVMYSEKMKSAKENSPEAKSYNEISAALERIMKNNSEKFSEYITTIRNGNTDIKNKVEYAYIKKVLDEKVPTSMTKSLTKKIDKKIDKALDSIREEDGNISRDGFEKYFIERTEDIADTYMQQKSKRCKNENFQLAQEKQKNSTTENKKDNPIVSWIKNTVGHVANGLKKFISRNGDKKIDTDEIKLLDEPKEKVQSSEKKMPKNFVQIIDIDHQKALEETNRTGDALRFSEDTRDV